VALDEASGRAMPAWRELFDHPQLDAYWEAERYQNKFDRVQVPVLVFSMYAACTSERNCISQAGSHFVVM
jgi:predicted acyl esterase